MEGRLKPSFRIVSWYRLLTASWSDARCLSIGTVREKRITRHAHDGDRRGDSFRETRKP